MGSVKKETIQGAKWMMLQKVTLQPVQLVFGMILARLLTPDEFGILGLTAIFFAVAASLASGGLGSALIREIHRTDADINTVFWSNIVFSAIMAAVLALCAPLFVWFFNQPALLLLTYASAGIMFLNSISSIHNTLFHCERNFKTPAIISIVTCVVTVPLTILVAYWGWSYWALIFHSALNALLNMIILWWVSPWKPRMEWSRDSFRRLFGYGCKLMVTGVIENLFANLKSLLIGKFYQPAQLGLFDRAWKLASLPSSTVNGMLQTVTFPILASIQEDENRLLKVYSMYVRITSLVIFFVSCLLVALAEPVVRLMYGEQWLSCVPYLQIVLWGVMCFHFGTINVNLLLVKGRSDIVLRISIWKKLISVALVLPAVYISMTAVCWASVLFIPFSLLINSYYTGRLFSFTLRRQLRDFVPYLFASALVCVPSYFVTHLPIPDIVQIVLGVTSAVVIYVLILRVCKDSAFSAIIETAEEKGLFRKLPLLRHLKIKEN